MGDGMRKWSGAFFVLVIANAVVSFAVWGQHATAQAYKNSAGMFADVSETKSPSAALMVAQNMAKGASFTSTQSIQSIGVCLAADSSGDMGPVSIVPGASVEDYQRNIEKLPNWQVPPRTVTVTVLEDPSHGTLSETSVSGRYLYTSTSGYAGRDTATFLTDIGGKQLKIVYFIKVYDSEIDDHTGCDDPSIWRISLNQNNVDPSAVAFGLPEALSKELLKNVNVSLNVVKLTDINVLISTSRSIALSERYVEYGWVLKRRSKIPSGSRRNEVAI
ncbi:MAG: hypothetical protein ABUS47_08740 [Steroidobacter sp.]